MSFVHQPTPPLKAMALLYFFGYLGAGVYYYMAVDRKREENPHALMRKANDPRRIRCPRKATNRDTRRRSYGLGCCWPQSTRIPEYRRVNEMVELRHKILVLREWKPYLQEEDSSWDLSSLLLNLLLGSRLINKKTFLILLLRQTDGCYRVLYTHRE